MNFFNVKLEREGQDVVAKFGDNKVKFHTNYVTVGLTL